MTMTAGAALLADAARAHQAQPPPSPPHQLAPIPCSLSLSAPVNSIGFGAGGYQLTRRERFAPYKKAGERAFFPPSLSFIAPPPRLSAHLALPFPCCIGLVSPLYIFPLSNIH